MHSLGVLIGGHKSGSMHSDFPSCFDHSEEGRGGPDAIQLSPDPWTTDRPCVLKIPAARDGLQHVMGPCVSILLCSG